jgi:hypothetical protein
MRPNTEEGECEWEAINNEQEELNDNDRVYQTSEELLRKDCVLLDKLGEIIQAGSY